MNTVVCKLNWLEDMSAIIEELNPFRWKCFQVLLVGGENDEKSAKGRGKQFDKFRITDDQFEAFCERHRHLGDRFIPESNAVMAKSYLLLDEYMRFLDKGNGIEKTSRSSGMWRALRSVVEFTTGERRCLNPEEIAEVQIVHIAKS